jgi:hypothetical protein
MIAVLREALHVCCTAIAFLCLIATLTIIIAIATNELSSDPQAWMAVVFFAAAGVASWIASRAAASAH